MLDPQQTNSMLSKQNDLYNLPRTPSSAKNFLFKEPPILTGPNTQMLSQIGDKENLELSILSSSLWKKNEPVVFHGTSAFAEDATLQNAAIPIAPVSSGKTLFHKLAYSARTATTYDGLKISGLPLSMNQPAPKRLKPLVVKKVKIAIPTIGTPHPSVPSLVPPRDQKMDKLQLPWTAQYLDFPVLICEYLKPITLPPSLSQRKHVARLSIIFAFVSTEDLPNLTLVSRLFRYAGASFALISPLIPCLRFVHDSIRFCSPPSVKEISWKSACYYNEAVST